MSYFDRRQDESIRFCPVCDRRTMHTRPSPVALWTCKDSGHPHPTKEQQERGLKMSDNFESDIRQAVHIVLFMNHPPRVGRESLTCRVKDKWLNHAAYPSNHRINEVIDAMRAEGLVELVNACSTDCVYEGATCTPSCMSLEWVSDTPPTAPPEWEPTGERLRMDRRGYTPRQTSAERLWFTEDSERLPKYDPETGTYIRDDLPPMFECGCSRPKVLAGKCDLYGPDGRERGWEEGEDE